MGNSGGSSGIGNTPEAKLQRLLDKYKDAEEMWHDHSLDDKMDELFTEEELEKFGEDLAEKLVGEGKQIKKELDEIYQQMRDDVKTMDQVVKQFYKENGEPPAYSKYGYEAEWRRRDWQSKLNRVIDWNVPESHYDIYLKNGNYVGVDIHSGDNVPKGLRAKDIAYIRFSDGWGVRDSYGVNPEASKSVAAIYGHLTSHTSFEDQIERIMKRKRR